MSKRLVLLGGGHAHVQVLHALAREPMAGADVLLITPFARQMYSGMVPGLVAGHYTADQCAIPLTPLAAAAGVPMVEGMAVALDAAARVVHLADGRTAEYDVLSLDTGASMDRDRIRGARDNAMFVRPIEHFVRLLGGLVELARQRVVDVVVVGGGAAGVELALALQYRLAGADGAEERARVALVTGGPAPLQDYPPAVMRHAAAVLAARRVTVFRDTCAELQPGVLVLGSGARLACDAPVLATGAEPPPWLAGSGLQLDVRGFVCTGPTLQSCSHPEVFAAGDVASRVDAPHPRSGVYAVRAGPPLLLNLRRHVAGGVLQPHQPQRRTLNLISCGERRAIMAWGDWAAQGRWAWWWKDRIDRRFIARYTCAQVAG
ncbi:MAG TPA: FAD-dependent oxidoreductase [Rubrivivax sp.]|nr:FAD-dependent oxidoreductase [Rubrivivax sp.]